MPAINHGGRTVADFLTLDAQTAPRSLPPYDPNDELRPSMRARGHRGSYRRASDVDALLTPFLQDALAGVPDRLIGRRTGLSAQQVKHWRQRRRIQGRRGRAPDQLGTHFLIGTLLGEETAPVAHETSVVGGTWRPPSYALRRPLQYELLVRAVGVLVTEMTTEEIALAVGIEERDIELALAIGTERGAQ